MLLVFFCYHGATSTCDGTHTDSGICICPDTVGAFTDTDQYILHSV